MDGSLLVRRVSSTELPSQSSRASRGGGPTKANLLPYRSLWARVAGRGLVWQTDPFHGREGVSIPLSPGHLDCVPTQAYPGPAVGALIVCCLLCRSLVANVRLGQLQPSCPFRASEPPLSPLPGILGKALGCFPWAAPRQASRPAASYARFSSRTTSHTSKHRR